MPHAISPVGSRPLDFHNVLSLDQEQQQQAVTALDPLYCTAFATLNPNWSRPIHQSSQYFRDAMQKWRKAVLDPLIGKSPRANLYYELALSFGDTMYRMVDLENRINVCQLLAIATVIDDQMPKDPHLQRDAKCFMRDLRSGRPPTSPLLRTFAEYVNREADAKADPLASDYLWHSWLNFIIGTNFEETTPTLVPAMQLALKKPRFKRPEFGSSGLPYFIRIKSGVAEAVMVTMFAQNGDHPIPFDFWFPLMSDIVLFTNLVNDLLSAPKELFASDESTYLNYQTCVKRQVGTHGSSADGRWCFEDTILETLELSVQAINRVDAMVDARFEQELSTDSTSQAFLDAKFVRDTWAMYKAGYMNLHVDSARYRCATLLPGLQRLRMECCGMAADDDLAC